MGKLAFIVFALPRTKSYWLSRFLSYKGLVCEHDYLDRNFDNPWMIGTVETGQVPFWRDIKVEHPLAKTVTVRRDFDQIADSLEKLDLPVSRSDMLILMEYLTVCMDNVERLYPDTLAITYDDLQTEEGCKKVFEYIMEIPFDREWWLSLKDQNLQVDTIKLRRAFDDL